MNTTNRAEIKILFKRNHMNKNTGYIFSKMKEYSKIPSTTGNERVFMEYLKGDFPTGSYRLYDNADCLFYEYTKSSPWLVLAHVDRIPVDPFDFEIIDGSLIKGQVDNAVSVGILRLLAEQNTPLNMLLTTEEETLQSCPQIVKVCMGKDYRVLDLDIDVAVDMQEIEHGGISLRDRDSTAEFDKELVCLMRKICSDHRIDYLVKDGHWLVDQIGCVIKGVPSIRGMYLGLPIFNYHSNEEIINMRCVDNAVKLLKKCSMKNSNCV